MLSRPVSFDWLDGLLLGCSAVLGGAVAWTLVHQTGSVFFYQAFTPEVLMWACGHGFRHPLPLSPDMVSFLVERSVAAFDCASITADLPTGPAGIFFHTQLYLSGMAAILWKILGTNQVAMAPLAAFLGAGYASGSFMLARLFLPRWLAAAAALALALSPVAISLIFLLRDFSKAPFLLWSIALLILTARATAARSRLWTAWLAGMVAGLGFGFRTDLAIILPLGVGFLALAPLPSTFTRIGLIGAFVGGGLLSAFPILPFSAGTTGGDLVMQGATEPFRRFLALDPAPYALGHAYSDELTATATAAEERWRRPNWDAGEGVPYYGVSQAITLSSKNLAGWAPHFAADFMAQALKGAAWILGYPALVAKSRGSPDPGTQLRVNVPIARWQEPVYALFGQPWMPAFGFAGVLALLLRVAARSQREALATAGLLLALLTYPMIQFSTRHVFYLEFVWVIGLLSLPCALWEWRRLLPVLPRFMLSVVLGVGLLAAVYAGLARLQQGWLASEFSDLLSLPREKVAVTRTVRDDGAVLLRVPVPTAQRAIVDGAPDSQTPRLAEIGLAYNVRAGGERMIMTVGETSCPPTPALIRLAYDHRPDVWQPLDSTLTITPGAIAVFPAFYRATQNFSGVVLPASHAGCEVELFRLPMTHDLPLVLTAVLPPNWRSLRLRKGLGWFDLGPLS